MPSLSTKVIANILFHADTDAQDIIYDLIEEVITEAEKTAGQVLTKR